MVSRARDKTFTTSDGANIAFGVYASPNPAAPRVALIHSLALDRSVWDGVVAHLQHDAEILVYDCRGHGRSDRKAGLYTAELFARDLAELLDHIGWSSATLAGCSMGGCVALSFAARFPARASRLALIDTTASYGPDAPARFRERAEAARAGGMHGLANFQVTRWFSDGFRQSHPEVVERTMGVFVENDFDCYAASCALLGAADLLPYLRWFRMPVAIVVGEEDYATPVSMARQLNEHIPQSTLTVLPGARHLTPVEYPDRVASEILALLRRSIPTSETQPAEGAV